GLEPGGLPDPRAARVPDGVRLELPILLAARLGQVPRIVLRANDDLLVAAAQLIGDVRRERRVAAFVMDDARSVHPHRRGVIDGPEVQQQAFAVATLGGAERATVPARAEEAVVVDAAF